MLRVCMEALRLLEFQKLAGVAGKNLLAIGRPDLERLDSGDGAGDQPLALLRVERRVGCEQAVRRAEIGVAAAGRRSIAVERGICIEELEVVSRRAFEFARARIAVAGAEKDLPKAEPDPTRKVGNHPA